MVARVQSLTKQNYKEGETVLGMEMKRIHGTILLTAQPRLKTALLFDTRLSLSSAMMLSNISTQD